MALEPSKSASRILIQPESECVVGLVHNERKVAAGRAAVSHAPHLGVGVGSAKVLRL